MKIVPDTVEQRINRVDRTPSLVIGIICAVVAVGCLLSLLHLLWVAVAFSSVGWFLPTLLVQLLIYVVVGGAALIGAVGFLTRYQKLP
jgi:hypothetical protein